MEKKINIIMDNSNQAFYATQASVHFSLHDFCIDFGQATPRVNATPKGEEMSYVNKHATIMLTPMLAKRLFELLGGQLAKFEKSNGQIKIPKESKKKARTIKKSAEVPNEMVAEGTTKYIG